MQPNSRALKVQARAAMSASQPSFWTVTLFYVFLVTILPALIYEVFDASLYGLAITTLENTAAFSATSLLDAALVGLFVSLVISLTSMVFQFGYSLWALRCWRRESENGLGSLFEGFSSVFRILLCNILVSLNMLGWCCLLLIAATSILTPLLFTSLDVLSYILLPIYLISILVACVLIVLRYSLVLFVLIDRPELGVFRVIALSTSLMRTHLWRMLRLQLSFAGWYLLGGILSWGSALLLVHLSGQLITNLSDPWSILELTTETLPYWIGLLSQAVISLFLAPYRTISVSGFYDSLIQPPSPQPNTYHSDIY